MFSNLAIQHIKISQTDMCNVLHQQDEWENTLYKSSQLTRNINKQMCPTLVKIQENLYGGVHKVKLMTEYFRSTEVFGNHRRRRTAT